MLMGVAWGMQAMNRWHLTRQHGIEGAICYAFDLSDCHDCQVCTQQEHGGEAADAGAGGGGGVGTQGIKPRQVMVI